MIRRCPRLARSIASSTNVASANKMIDNAAKQSCPYREVQRDEPLDIGVVRDLLQNPVALAHCPFAQRAAASPSVQAVLARNELQQEQQQQRRQRAVAPQSTPATATTTSVPYHATRFFEQKLEQLKANRHYRTFRYLRR